MKMFLSILIVCLLAGCASKPKALPPEPESHFQEEVPPPPEPVPPPAPPATVEKTIFLQPLTVSLVEELDQYAAVPDFQYYISNMVVLISDNTGGLWGSRDIIIIDAIIKGEVINIRRNAAGKMVLEVCFDPENPGAMLCFTESGPEGYFDLETDNGTIQYGDMRYQVQVGADKLTRLLIDIENTIGPGTHPRYLAGRDIGDERSNIPGEFQLIQPLSQTRVPQEQYSAEQEQEPEPEPVLEFIPEVEHVAEIVPHAAPSFPAFKVQVGSFLDREHAQAAFERLIAAGFTPGYERWNEYYRVVIAGIAAGDLPEVTRRLDIAGFSNPWIREEDWQ